MKWFKHDASAMADAKLKRVKMKYGMQGYGLYWYCLELIAQNVDKHNLTFELEHDAEIIALDTGIHQELVEEMMKYMIQIDLFESSGGRIYCLKMATRTDEYTQKIINSAQNINKLSRQTPDIIPIKSRECPTGSRIKSDLIEEKEEKEEKEESIKPGRFTPPTLEEVTSYCKERCNFVDPEKFIDHYESSNWFRGKTKIKDWKACVRTWEKSSQQEKNTEVQSWI